VIGLSTRNLPAFRFEKWTYFFHNESLFSTKLFLNIVKISVKIKTWRHMSLHRINPLDFIFIDNNHIQNINDHQSRQGITQGQRTSSKRSSLCITSITFYQNWIILIQSRIIWIFFCILLMIRNNEDKLFQKLTMGILYRVIKTLCAYARRGAEARLCQIHTGLVPASYIASSAFWWAKSSGKSY